MQDVAAARARLIDLFMEVGRSLIDAHCGRVPEQVYASIRQNVTVHISGRADSDIIALASMPEDELRALANDMLGEPLRHMAEIVRRLLPPIEHFVDNLMRTTARNGMDN